MFTEDHSQKKSIKKENHRKPNSNKKVRQPSLRLFVALMAIIWQSVCHCHAVTKTQNIFVVLKATLNPLSLPKKFVWKTKRN